MNRRLFLKATAGAAIAATAGTALCAYGCDTHDIETTTVPLAIGLGKPLRVAVVGDIHFDPLYEVKYIAGVVKMVNALRPDMILYTGDFITAHADHVNAVSDLLSFAEAPLGCFAVPGNHEHWTGIEHIMGSLAERAGIKILINESVPLPENDNFYLTGIDSFWAGNPDLSIFSRTEATSHHIVLVHEPDSFPRLTDPRIKLQISGHTHGGQVRLPLYGALILPHMGKLFETGLFERDGRRLYVNRGIGTLVPHIRINCRPEITILELT